METQKSTVVVTGSAAQVQPEIAAQLGIVILPLIVVVDGKEHLDGVDIFPGELYQKMRTQNIEVKTAAPNVGQYYECFKRIINQQGSDILCLTLSSQLSSDYNAAVEAAKMLSEENQKNRVTVFDSLRAAAPQGLLAVEAAKRLHAGETLEDTVQYLQNARYKSGLIAALDTLEYLAKGGRIGKAAYLVGSALQIIPILTINNEGIVAPSTVIRKKRNIIPTFLSTLARKTAGYKRLSLSVMHADSVDQVETLRHVLREQYPTLEIPISEITPVMGAHSGPGLLGLGYFFE